MSGALAALPASGPPSLPERIAAHTAAVDGAAAEIAAARRDITAAMRAGTPLSPLAAALISSRLASLEQELFKDADLLAAAAQGRTFEQMREARQEARQAAQAPVPEVPRRRRRPRAVRPPWLDTAAALVPAAAALVPAAAAVLRHPVQHALTALPADLEAVLPPVPGG